MPLWLRKSLVVLISILSLGIVSPSQASELLPSQSKSSGMTDAVQAPSSKQDEQENEEDIRESFMERVMKQAEEQSLEKFGTRIGPVIEDEFRQIILPNIEQAIVTVAEQFPEEELANLAISEAPGGGLSEKIFHIYGHDQKDIIRFHVRRDRPPHEGYWFNFHFHTYHDSFQTHYDLGSIYWAKNTPPKWRT
jgi:hypothetical protein